MELAGLDRHLLALAGTDQRQRRARNLLHGVGDRKRAQSAWTSSLVSQSYNDMSS